MSQTRVGSCLCGSIHFKLTGEPIAKVVCYCNGCRKNSGHLGQIMGKFSTESVDLQDDDNCLGKYKVTNTFSGHPKEKQFCNRCGCTIRTLLGSDPGFFYVRTTLVDDGFAGLEPTVGLYEEIKLAFTGDVECRLL